MKQFRDDQLERYAKIISCCRSENLILTSEHFQSRLCSDSEVDRLHSALKKLGVLKVFVIVYLREPAELAASLYCMNVKNGSTAAEPGGPESPYYANICDHKRTIERFGKRFGLQNIRPRLFSKNDFCGGDLITDFLDALGISEVENFVRTPSQNKRLSNLGVELLRRVNQQIPLFNDDGINPYYEKVIRHFETFYCQTKYNMPDELTMQYRAAFESSCEWVRERYFSKKKNLFDPATCHTATPDLDVESLDLIARSIAAVFIEGQHCKDDANNGRETKEQSGIWSFIYGKKAG